MSFNSVSVIESSVQSSAKSVAISPTDSSINDLDDESRNRITSRSESAEELCN